MVAVTYTETGKRAYDKEDHGKIASAYIQGCDHYHSTDKSHQDRHYDVKSMF